MVWRRSSWAVDIQETSSSTAWHIQSDWMSLTSLTLYQRHKSSLQSHRCSSSCWWGGTGPAAEAESCRHEASMRWCRWWLCEMIVRTCYYCFSYWDNTSTTRQRCASRRHALLSSCWSGSHGYHCSSLSAILIVGASRCTKFYQQLFIKLPSVSLSSATIYRIANNYCLYSPNDCKWISFDTVTLYRPLMWCPLILVKLWLIFNVG